MIISQLKLKPLHLTVLLAAVAITFVIGSGQVSADAGHDHVKEPAVAPAEAHHPPAGHAQPHEPATPIERDSDYVGDPYPLNTCPVSGAEFAEEGPVAIKDIDGREVRFCCNGCAASFAANPENFVPELDAKIVADQLPHYPLDTCVVTDAELGSMGDPIDYVYNNRLVRFCCGGCISEFESNPGEYMTKLNEAVIAKQTATYPLDHCIVLPDEEIGGEETVDYVIANRLFRLCCAGCVNEIVADPAKWIAELDAASK